MRRALSRAEAGAGEFLPLSAENWIVCGNALRLDWLSVCPPTGTGVKAGLRMICFTSPLDRAEIDFENEGVRPYICGNPPYLGKPRPDRRTKDDLRHIWTPYENWKSLDYVAGWFIEGLDYGLHTACSTALCVKLNSICQNSRFPVLCRSFLPAAMRLPLPTSFKWSNLASYNAR